MIGYESFMVEVGLYGNTMSYKYKTHSMLATNNTWYKKCLGIKPLFQYLAELQWRPSSKTCEKGR
jgi:hypothetical protein